MTALRQLSRSRPGRTFLGPVGGAAAVAGGVYWRKRLRPSPYGLRLLVQIPHPVITRARLVEILEPTPGERILEVGPGTGYYSLTVARRIAPSGRLDAVDFQQEMVDHLAVCVERHGALNISAERGDVHALAYPDAAFDAAYLVLTFGELGDPATALLELARVVRPGGRVVVGELFGSPHWTPFGALAKKAQRAGLEFERRNGRWLSYFARFRRVTHCAADGMCNIREARRPARGDNGAPRQATGGR